MTDVSIPYTLCNDSIILSLLILNILGFCYTIAGDGYSIAERIKSMYFHSKHSNPYNDRTDITPFGNTILYILVIFCSAIIALNHILHKTEISDRANVYIALGIFAATFTVFLLIKKIIYSIVNLTLFSKEQTKEWNESYFFTIKIMGFILLPISALLIIYPDISDIITIIYLGSAIILYLIMLTIRCFSIIFTEKCYFLDIFLYLCAIELLPLGFMWYAINKTNLFEIIKI